MSAPLSPVPRIALRVAEAASACGVSEDFYAKYIAHEVKVIRRGKLKLVAVAELARWCDDNAERLMEGVTR